VLDKVGSDVRDFDITIMRKRIFSGEKYSLILFCQFEFVLWSNLGWKNREIIFFFCSFHFCHVLLVILPVI